MRSTIQNLKIITIAHYLIIYFMTVGFGHGFQVNEKLLQEIATLNNEIIYLQSTTSAASDEPISNRMSRSTPVTFVETGTTSYGQINPFVPTTDENGIPLCLKNSSYENFCTEDNSFPESFANMIQPAVAASLTSLQLDNNIYECGSEPNIQCKYATKKLIPPTLKVLTLSSRRSSEPEFAFALQTADFQQSILFRFCKPDPQSCTVGSQVTNSMCRNAGPSPSYSPVRQVETPNNVIIINSAGLAEVAEIVGPETPISCWCICDDNVFPNLP